MLLVMGFVAEAAKVAGAGTVGKASDRGRRGRGQCPPQFRIEPAVSRPSWNIMNEET